ncbi:DUF4181 domain-containing protein [Psychrobacillus sp. FSL W7-1493]|uniref:DUF4181 domain-containing protein n=1 Tax=Psychrobacillus sp. FSL W7-1493 TaxID=2921552 RepID=UPI0030F755B4
MMTVDMYIALIFLLLVIYIVLRYSIRQKYNISTHQRLFVNTTQKWIEIILIVLGSVLFVLFLIMEDWVFVYLLMAVLVVLLCHRAFVSYKYEREERQYMITLVDLGTFCILFSIVIVGYI